jgi:pyrrolidone-carboxylate peptidase
MTTLLITAFGPFEKYKVNTSEYLLESFDRFNLYGKSKKIKVDKRIIHVNQKSVKGYFRDICKEYIFNDEKKYIFLHLGMAPHIQNFHLVKRAKNEFIKQPIIKEIDRENYYCTKFNVCQMLPCLPINTKISKNTGTYIRNYLYFLSLLFTYPNPNCKSLFVHVPHHDIVKIDKQERFLSLLIEQLIQDKTKKTPVLSPVSGKIIFKKHKQTVVKISDPTIYSPRLGRIVIINKNRIKTNCIVLEFEKEFTLFIPNKTVVKMGEQIGSSSSGSRVVMNLTCDFKKIPWKIGDSLIGGKTFLTKKYVYILDVTMIVNNHVIPEKTSIKYTSKRWKAFLYHFKRSIQYSEKGKKIYIVEKQTNAIKKLDKMVELFLVDWNFIKEHEKDIRVFPIPIIKREKVNINSFNFIF